MKTRYFVVQILLTIGSLGALTSSAHASATTNPAYLAEAQFLLTGLLSNGHPPTLAQAVKVAEQYPAGTIPTLAQLNEFTAGPVSADPVYTAQGQPTKGTPANLLPVTEHWWSQQTFDQAGMFGVVETNIFTCNTRTEKITDRKPSGYEFVHLVFQPFWHASGYVTGNGFPLWTHPSIGVYREEIIAVFGWGWGPVSGTYDMHLFVEDHCSSKYGAFGLGGRW